MANSSLLRFLIHRGFALSVFFLPSFLLVSLRLGLVVFLVFLRWRLNLNRHDWLVEIRNGAAGFAALQCGRRRRVGGALLLVNVVHTTKQTNRSVSFLNRFLRSLTYFVSTERMQERIRSRIPSADEMLMVWPK